MFSAEQKHALHRAAIRTTIINASLDITEMLWTMEEDQLLDTIDQWLVKKTEQARALTNIKPLDPEFTMGAGKAQVSINPIRKGDKPMPKVEHDFSAAAAPSDFSTSELTK